MTRPGRIILNENTIKILYKKHKSVLFPIVIVLLSFFIFLRVVIPQIGNYFEVRRQAEEEQKKLNILKNNLSVLSSLNDSLLDSNLKIAGAALPIGKDFAGILTAILVSSGKSGVSLGNFEFSVGELDSEKSPSSSKTYPSIRISLVTQGGLQDVKRFTEELKKSLPLSDIISLKLGPQSSTVDLLFYYKPLPPLNIRSEQPINHLSSDNNNVLGELTSWNNYLTSGDVSLPTVSPSPFPEEESSIIQQPSEAADDNKEGMEVPILGL